MKAVIGGNPGQYRLVDGLDTPRPGPGTMLCRVHAVALNPADAKMADFAMTPGAIGGADFAGTVVEVGDGVTRFRAGDRVFALAFGLNPANSAMGAFAEYSLATEHLTCKIAEGMSFEESCSMGVAVATAGMALFHELRLPLPLPLPAPTPGGSTRGAEERVGFSTFPVLVSGGATCTGTMAIQFLKCAGLTPIVTCSPSNFALCRSYGAAACFDYNLPGCGDSIRMYTDDKLAHVLDCVTDSTTMKMCYKAIGPAGGTYVALETFPTTVQYTRRDVRASWILGSSLFGHAVEFSGAYGRPASRAHRDFAARLFPLVEGLLDAGLIKNHPIDVRGGGLGALAGGIEELRKGKVRAKKLVFPLVGVEGQ
ncbi:chaperonin 10-like protein [Colletotrichum cereale]|nr:chaperonin 10-like protein [Colletotrichum cereale]